MSGDAGYMQCAGPVSEVDAGLTIILKGPNYVKSTKGEFYPSVIQPGPPPLQPDMYMYTC